MKKNKLNIRYILLESFFIVLTVSLALVLSQWRENVKEQRKKREVLTAIENEINENIASINLVKEYHIEMSKKISGFLESDTAAQALDGMAAAPMLVQLLDRGISPPQIQNSAWRSAEITGIVSTFDFEIISSLSRYYDIQNEGVESTWKVLAELFSDPSSYKEEEAENLILLTSMGLRELHQQENYLIYLGEEALKMMKGEKKDNSKSKDNESGE